MLKKKDTQRLLKIIFNKQLGRENNLDLNNTILNHPLRNQAVAQLVFIDGVYAPEFSKSANLVGLAIVADWKTALLDYAHLIPDSVEEVEEGFFCYLTEKAQVSQLVHFLFICTENAVARNRSLKFNNLIIAKLSSNAKIFVEYLGFGEKQYELNSTSKIYLENNAQVSYYNLQNNNLNSIYKATLEVKQSAASKFSNNHFVFGSALAEENLNIKLQGEGALCNLYSLSLVNGKRDSKWALEIEHLVPKAESHTLHKSIITDQAHAGFRGKIKIAPQAQQSIAHLKNHNLLLSDDASVDSAPELEIYADDVKCTHGSTVGCLDEKSLFYLRARGIPDKTAKEMLLQAFMQEMLDKIENETLREYVGDCIIRNT